MTDLPAEPGVSVVLTFDAGGTLVRLIVDPDDAAALRLHDASQRGAIVQLAQRVAAETVRVRMLAIDTGG